MKRLVVCCDGTWQSQDNEIPTNVFKIAQAVTPSIGHGEETSPSLSVKQTDERENKENNKTHQILYYDQGIGAVPSRGGTQSLLKSVGDSIEKIGGGAFGWWIDEKIEEAYIFLCLNYEPGDEIYLFGFSRGAYTVRSLKLIEFIALTTNTGAKKKLENFARIMIFTNQSKLSFWDVGTLLALWVFPILLPCF